MVMDTAALAVSAGATYATRNVSEALRLRLPLLVFPFLAAADVFSIHRELKAIQLRSLNRVRAEMVAERWLDAGGAGGGGPPSMLEVSRAETLLGPPNIAGGFLPLAFEPVEALAGDPRELGRLLASHEGCAYLLALRPGHPRRLLGVLPLPGGGGGGGGPPPRLSVALSDDAGTLDILTAVLQASLLRRALRGLPHARLAAGDPAVEAALRDSRAAARRQAPGLVAEMAAKGWQTGPFLLSTSEKARYVRLGEGGEKAK
jgi:glutamate N-acetyltransferase/amino-acid N-acetyltransferase